MRKVGILIERQRAFGRQLCTGIVQYAQTRDDWSLSMLDWDDLKRPSRFRDFDGFVVRVLNKKIADFFSRMGKPVVDVFEGHATKRFVKVIQHAARISQLAVRHFMNHHFATFGFFGHEGVEYSDMRRDAFVASLRQRRRECHVYHTPSSALKDFEYVVMRAEKYSADQERQTISDWLKGVPKPIAVFCSHDLRAYQLIEACHESGIAVPSEVAVLGVDDDELLCNFTEPTISSIDPNAQGIGFKAAEVLGRLMSGEVTEPLFRVEPNLLVERKSTATFPLDPSWMSDALVFIYGKVKDRLSASDVYRHVGLSHTIVNKAFQRTLGTTVAKEISKSRFKEALRLVTTTDLPFSDVAARSGFASVQYFTRSFTAAYGKCPSRARGEGNIVPLLFGTSGN